MASEKIEKWLTPENLLRLEGWARDGLSFEQIAHNCGCNKSTLLRWRKMTPELDAALKRGREVVDYEVENALLKRALGYEYQETRVEVSEKDGRKVTELMKHAKPDVGAATFWLTHRQRDKYGERKAEPAAGCEEAPFGCIVLPEAAAAEDEGTEADGPQPP